jgi:hypothetical protein
VRLQRLDLAVEAANVEVFLAMEGVGTLQE